MSARDRKDRRKAQRSGADWRGIVLASSPTIKGKKYLEFDGYKYCTHGEMELAQVLKARGIPFTPDVEFRLVDDDPNASRSTTIYVPDFIFDREDWHWVDEDGNRIPIQGFEVKATPPSKGYMPSRGHPLGGRLFKKQVLLFEQRGILVPVVSDAEVSGWAANGDLPIEAIRPRKK